MDRRQRLGFQPGSEDLEGRQMLSTATASAPAPTAATAPTRAQASAVQTASTQGVVLATAQQKAERIQNLPYWINQLDPGRPLPTQAIKEMQYWMTQVSGTLGAVPSGTLNAFNVQMRGLVGQTSISSTDITTTQAYFTKCLQQAGASSAAVAGLSNSMLQLARSDSQQSSRPAALVANDYALVLQTTLAVGRPLAAPAPPRLVPADDTGAKNDNTTSNRRPGLTGVYQPNMTMRLIDVSGAVIGTAPTNAQGQYTVTPNSLLPVGNNTLRIQGQEASGLLSLPSRPFTIRIVSS